MCACVCVSLFVSTSSLYSQLNSYTHTHTHTHTQPFLHNRVSVEERVPQVLKTGDVLKLGGTIVEVQLQPQNQGESQ